MENKINIAEILKDCPKGMELDCTLFEGLEFDDIVDNEYLPIRCRVKNPDGGYNVYNFTKYGCWLDTTFAKCVIFPKGKTTWEGFIPPCKFKDGDIVISDMGDIHLLRTKDSSCCAYRKGKRILPEFDSTLTTNVTIVRLATEEEKQKLFQAIKANGYKWNAETKTLEKLIVPKFKVGDRIKDKNNKIWFVVQVSDKHFSISLIPNAEGYFVPIEDQDDYELVPNKFDITTLKPFDKVLVRNKSNEVWTANFYSHYDATSDKPFICVGWSEMNEYRYCIPYDVNKELLGTTNNS